jgi:hypothetical protein
MKNHEIKYEELPVTNLCYQSAAEHPERLLPDKFLHVDPLHDTS